MKRIFYLLLALCFCAVMSGCEKPPVPEIEEVPDGVQGGMFILNEGNYGSGNASLGFFDFKENKTTQDVFTPANGRPLGDVLQSMALYEGKAYLVLNNSSRIEVIDPVTFKVHGTISGLRSPRYLVPGSAGKAYVSDLTDNFISVVDLASLKVVKQISMRASTESMAFVNEKLFVCNSTGTGVIVVDGNTDIVIDTIELSYGPNSLQLDKDNMLWVLCSGKKDQGFKAGLYRVNPVTHAVDRKFTTLVSAGYLGANKLQLNGSKDKLYWLNGDVYSCSITDTVPPPSPYITSNSNSFYGIGIDPRTGELYLSDALDFSQRSIINRYDKYGVFRGFFLGGMITNGFYFNYR